MDAASSRRWARLALVRVRAQRRVQRRFVGARNATCSHDLWIESMALVIALDHAQKEVPDA